MKKITWVFWGFLLALSALWLMADTLWPAQPGVRALRAAWMQYSGTLAFGAMSLAALLAARPLWLEQRLGGLDKAYRLHKWLGIAALTAALVHWLWAKGPKWAIGWGWLADPGRKPKAPPDADLGMVEAALRQYKHLAEDIGGWAFYAAVALIVLALLRRFPYRLFAKTHKLMPMVYLALVCHAVGVVRFSYWSQPVGWAIALLMAAGAVSAARALLGRVGARRTAGGVIEALQHYPALDVLETTIRVDERWQGHRPGQFAFATFDAQEGAHPFTIASAWSASAPRLTFITKALGDHTRTLARRLRVGAGVKIEGPYGCFTFDDGNPRQIWVGGGIGITPFIARLGHLAQGGGSAPTIDLFHCTAEYDPAAIGKLRADAESAGARLHLFVEGKDGRLTGERLRALVPEWKQASVWFCGPVAFARALRADLLAHGLPAHAFHQELFQMR
jgi:predicted ferric reductase